MTFDDVAKPIIGVVMSLLSAAVGWVFRRTLANRESVLVLEGKVKGLATRTENLEKEALTKEDVREVVDAALVKREETTELKVREAVREEIYKAFKEQQRED